jgi:hypothetical protein
VDEVVLCPAVVLRDLGCLCQDPGKSLGFGELSNVSLKLELIHGLCGKDAPLDMDVLLRVACEACSEKFYFGVSIDWPSHRSNTEEVDGLEESEVEITLVVLTVHRHIKFGILSLGPYRCMATDMSWLSTWQSTTKRVILHASFRDG